MTTETENRVDMPMPTGPVDFSAMRVLIDSLERNAAEASKNENVTATVTTAPAPRRKRRRQQMESTTMATPTPTPNRPNALTFAELMTTAADLGTQAGKGKDTQAKALLKLLEGGFLGCIDLDPDKHGVGISDAHKLAESYANGQAGAAIFDAKAPNQRKLVSTFRKMIEVGMWTKGGPGEPLSTFNNFVVHRNKKRQKPDTAKRLDDAANSILRLARAQLKRDHVIDPSEFDSFCYKPVADAKTAEEVLEAIRKMATALRDGKASHGLALDNSTEVQDIVKLCTKRLTAVAKAKNPQPQQKAAFTTPTVA